MGAVLGLTAVCGGVRDCEWVQLELRRHSGLGIGHSLCIQSSTAGGQQVAAESPSRAASPAAPAAGPADHGSSLLLHGMLLLACIGRHRPRLGRQVSDVAIAGQHLLLMC